MTQEVTKRIRKNARKQQEQSKHIETIRNSGRDKSASWTQCGNNQEVRWQFKLAGQKTKSHRATPKKSTKNRKEAMTSRKRLTNNPIQKAKQAKDAKTIHVIVL